ncbi:hypothetical protein LCGC14_2143540 [marine sediment metagenome]|uniref:Uncharacterized protein n=1 Tax=marine sediment metagenome TaxID=412755 RepID=A0A0F9GTX0_9ZZZZ
MSDYNRIDGVAFDRHITGNYGEDSFKGLRPCPKCEEIGEVVIDSCLCPAPMRGDGCYHPCPDCKGGGFIEESDMLDPGDDPDRKYDEERDRKMFDIDTPDELEE